MEIRRKPFTFIANRKMDTTVIAPRQPDPDMSARITAIGIFRGIGNQFIGDERDRNCAIGQDVDAMVGLGLDGAVGGGVIQVSTDLLDIDAKVETVRAVSLMCFERTSCCFFTLALELMIPRRVVRRFDRNAIFCRHGLAMMKALPEHFPKLSNRGFHQGNVGSRSFSGGDFPAPVPR
jgi:hypothetical protein